MCVYHQLLICGGLPALTRSEVTSDATVSLLTGGGDRPYVFGLATALASKGVTVDLIGSDELDLPVFRQEPKIKFLNLRGSLDSEVSLPTKITRLSLYYIKLICYAATARPRVFHILWNNKFETFDRTVLMLYYKLLRKKIVLTVHNVNQERRDSRDSFLNRLTLRIQYRLCHHLFVHTEKMKRELTEQFGVRGANVTVVPFGINNALPNTALTPGDAKRRLGLRKEDKAVLFFGRIKPYKGLDYMIDAIRQVSAIGESYRLIIAGRPFGCEEYWAAIRNNIHEDVQAGNILLRTDFIPDDEVEVYFKAADVLVLPYRGIYQSGVLFTGQGFGIPVLAADVGSFGEDITDGKSGFLFKPEDPGDLARTIKRYFSSELYKELDTRRAEIRADATKRHSWDIVGHLTIGVYAGLDRTAPSETSLNPDVPSASRDVKVSS
jgi:D-inositol-3-phosphate glycosyltransferase